MKKLLKADEIKAFIIEAGAAFAKEDFEQLIVAVSASANVAAETEADVVISHAATVGGNYAEFKSVTVALDAAAQFQVNLVGAKEFVKIAFEQNGDDEDLLVGAAVLADKRDVAEADVEELPVPAVIHDTIVL